MKAVAAAVLALSCACGAERDCQFVEGSPRFQKFDCEGVLVDVDGCPDGSSPVEGADTECECDDGDFVLDEKRGFICV
jgi:hypothetical protein